RDFEEFWESEGRERVTWFEPFADLLEWEPPRTRSGISAGSSMSASELRDHVAHKIGPIAKSANIVFTPELPKTRSGKIMRRLLRDVAENRTLGDTTTLADPTVVDEIKERATSEKTED